MYSRLLALALPLLFVTYVSATVIYKWVDDNGVTHFSQQIPENADEQSKSEKLYSEDIEPKSIGTVAPIASSKEPTKLSQAQQDAAQINQFDKEQAKEICKNAKYNLDILVTHTKLNSKDQQTGEVVAVTEEQRQQKIKMQKQRVALFCK
ncbi:DUF4124 domain-containing protein [Shewanella violacea]|uniref:DUF4124 domain-containing protein n=1 Tax=Shewanella violacea (strain JCM 10179 / CIP 106290 / LMG 19151 / DSS12) TaxID=637905 RepID=D4ZBJ8_SHEVD|nr:DUF4124 domain-containing protein [Shewanella violacea]BAJ03393.1 conserved hypothetical protein [Shewanella violacea DSS12]